MQIRYLNTLDHAQTNHRVYQFLFYSYSGHWEQDLLFSRETPSKNTEDRYRSDEINKLLLSYIIASYVCSMYIKPRMPGPSVHNGPARGPDVLLSKWLFGRLIRGNCQNGPSEKETNDSVYRWVTIFYFVYDQGRILVYISFSSLSIAHSLLLLHRRQVFLCHHSLFMRYFPTDKNDFDSIWSPYILWTIWYGSSSINSSPLIWFKT